LRQHYQHLLEVGILLVDAALEHVQDGNPFLKLGNLLALILIARAQIGNLLLERDAFVLEQLSLRLDHSQGPVILRLFQHLVLRLNRLHLGFQGLRLQIVQLYSDR